MAHNRARFNSTQHWRCFVVIVVLVQIITLSLCIYSLTSSGKLGKYVLSLENLAEENKAELELSKESVAEKDEIPQQSITDKKECGGIRYVDCITGDQQLINSPNTPLPSVSKLECKWDIRRLLPKIKSDHEKYFIFMEFQDDINIAYSPNCTTSVLEVREDSEQGPIRASYCGRNITADNIKYNGSLHVLYKTQDFNIGGFVSGIYCAKEATVPNAPITGEDSTYTIWGKFACPTYGPPIYSGLVVGYKGSRTVELQCAEPEPINSNSTDVGDINSPVLTSAQFNYGTTSPIGFPPVNRNVLDCAICLVQQATAFTLIGTPICPGRSYEIIYSGYLMAAKSSYGTASASICVADEPSVNTALSAGSSAPQISFVKSPSGLVVRCALCKSL